LLVEKKSFEMLKKFYNFFLSNLILFIYVNFYRIYSVFRDKNKFSTNVFEIIIFSFDRPLQIKSLLDSILIHIDDDILVNILFKCSDKSYRESYLKLINDYVKVTNRFNFIEQKGNFKSDFLNLIKKLEISFNKHFLFFVDDQIIFRDINLKNMNKLFKFSFLTTFRLGLNTTWSYNLNKRQSLEYYKRDIFQSHVIWRPKLIKEDISYPLSLDATTIPSFLVKIYANFLYYKGPNTFENSMNYSLLIFYLLKLKISSPLKQSAVNIVISLVNRECINRGNFINTKVLRDFYEKGWSLELNRKKINKIFSPHIDKYFYLKKGDQIKKL